ncbi:hypothetical protein ACLMAB_28870 [Brevibacillus laterosporus]
MFDPVSNKWTSAQSMPKPLRYVDGVSLDNNIYIIGEQTKIMIPIIWYTHLILKQILGLLENQCLLKSTHNHLLLIILYM